MRRFILLLCLVILAVPAHAQQAGRYILVETFEIGVSSNPNRLFIVDTIDGSISELLVERGSIFAPWFGWSPDGTYMAYMAPNRAGSNFEIWVGRPFQMTTPLFQFDLTVVSADWNPEFNILALGVAGADAQNGIYVLNVDTGNLVFMAEEELNFNGFLDWSNGAFRLAYSTAQNDLKILDTRDRSVITLASQMELQPNLLPNESTGWTADDGYYVFTNLMSQSVFALPTDRSSDILVDVPFAGDPFDVKLLDVGSQLLTIDERSFLQVELGSGNVQNFTTDLVVDAPYWVTENGQVVFNTFLVDAAGTTFADCYILSPDTGAVQSLNVALGDGRWSHLRCQLLEGGTHIGLMATGQAQDFFELPSDLRTTLYVTALEPLRAFLMTDDFAGFDGGKIGFSTAQGTLITQEGRTLILRQILGTSDTLASLADLDLNSDFIDYQFAWQP